MIYQAKENNKKDFGNIDLTIVIPAFNEDNNILPVVEDSIDFLNSSSLNGKYEIIVVNDGSTDNSKVIIDNITTLFTPVKSIHHDINRGFGAALKTGFAQSSGKYITFIPADGEVKVNQIIKLYNEIGGADIIVSARQGTLEEGQRAVRSLSRRILTWGFRFILIFCLRFDPAGMEGIYIIRREVLKEIKMVSETGLLHQEVIMRCHREGYQIKTSIMEFNQRLSGESKVANSRTIIKTIWEMIKIRFKS